MVLYNVYDMKKKNVENENKCKFVKEYDKYQKELVNYNLLFGNKEKKMNRTEYTLISFKDQSMNKSLPKIKSKILVKDEMVEAM